ncbi:MAG: very short patch repair endonuclease [Nitrospiraceae bacterium]|nr:MAG: very short patch repair endonuclease [Nitrospiraceae bacterium]
MRRKAPAYDLFKPSSELSSLIKKRTKSKNTSAELILRRYVWKLGLRYRIHVKNLPGKPDLVLPSAKVVVFCDGDFWHGRNWDKLKKQLRNRKNYKYWISKIKYNIERDILQEKELKGMGWRVLRFWETDVLKNPEFFALKIYEIVRSTK